MDFIKHPKHDRFIGKPANWDESVSGPCGALSVHEKPNPPYVPTFESAWLPSINELIAMGIGEYHLRLGIIGAQSHPPVYMTVYPNEGAFDDKAKLEAQYMVLFGALLQHAKVNGLDLLRLYALSHETTMVTNVALEQMTKPPSQMSGG